MIEPKVRYSMLTAVLRTTVLTALSLLLVSGVRAAQTGLSAQLNVLHADVDIQASGAVNWVPLRPGVQTAFGPGDRVRTSHSGRILLTFGKSFEILVLPDSVLELVTFAENDTKKIEFAALLDGHLIQRSLPGAQIDSYLLTFGTATISKPADLFAAWSEVEGYDVVTVAEGTAIYDNEAELPAAQGLLTTGTNDLFITDMAIPFNAARLIGEQSTCTGQIRNGGEANLNVRAAPALGATVIGNVADLAMVPIMAVNERGNWYRIQVVTGFGWVRAELVRVDCTDLPVLPNDTLENNVEMIEVTAQELEFLEPFYGQPDNNLWFYRSFAAS